MRKTKTKNRNRTDEEHALNVSVVRFSDEAARQLASVIGRTRRCASNRGASCGRSEDAAVRTNRARVVAAIRKLHDRVGLSVPKAVRRLRGNQTWSARMKGVADRSWASYYYEK